MKAMVQSGMAGASLATTMIRMRREASACHGSGTPCGCHVSPAYSPPSRIRQQSPSAANLCAVAAVAATAHEKNLCELPKAARIQKNLRIGLDTTRE